MLRTFLPFEQEEVRPDPARTNVDVAPGAYGVIERRAQHWVPRAVRILSHLAVWISVLVPAILTAARGWAPLGDYAAIQVRAYHVASTHPPLVGFYSLASTLGHTVFDPGPIAFWLLALPVRLDPMHGLLWGSAILWGLALSLAIEALWSARQWLGCALIGFTIVDLLWATPNALQNLAWNAYLPFPFLVLAIVTAYLVARGGFSWWPVLVFAASVAAQSHLLYVIPASALALLAPAVGLVNSRSGRPRRWLILGLLVGLLSWLAPLIQSLNGGGNLAALVKGSGKPALGFGFGLRMLGTAVGPSPTFLHQAPVGFFPSMGLTFSRSAAWGIAAVVVLAASCLTARLTRRRALFAISSVALTTCLGFAAAFAIIPSAAVYVVSYLVPVLWIISLLVWTIAVWSIISFLVAARPWLQRMRGLYPSVLHAGVSKWWGVAAGCSSISALVGLCVLGLSQIGGATPYFGYNWSAPEGRQVTIATALIEHRIPDGPVNLVINEPGVDPWEITAVTEGIGARLLADGWEPGLFRIDPSYSGLPPITNASLVVVTLDGMKVTDVTTSAPSHRQGQKPWVGSHPTSPRS